MYLSSLLDGEVPEDWCGEELSTPKGLDSVWGKGGT